ncbi:hypothetical protein T4B_4775 [Trichinella pseudospiralis]|uniref:Uncharacterized protein n=1 Tax=Trichinella pseudospiralis TaxID=6337 RepID=A0A0V1IR45_TRIPS|nr:hypothetical protein T4A_9510 [Trichinella pseudospiralis]KRZ25273.1 hypothetical protein T4B_4775 [Trichinella pseudospiralis]KRZ36916.1 hypothetical protein T4C_4116 [Trichinella pseudospiralis]
MEEFGRNFVYKQVGHIITAEEYKCQVQPSHRTDKSISKSTWAPEPQTCRRSSNGIWCSISVTVRSELDCNAKAFTLGWTCIRGEIYAKMSHREREICAERAQVACSYFLREKGEYGRKLLNIKRTRQGTMESYSSVGMILEAEWKFDCYRE